MIRQGHERDADGWKYEATMDRQSVSNARKFDVKARRRGKADRQKLSFSALTSQGRFRRGRGVRICWPL